jgi:hypothetical protein
MFCSFTNYLNALDRGKIGFLISAELLKGNTFGKSFNPADIIENVMKKNPDIPFLFFHT